MKKTIHNHNEESNDFSLIGRLKCKTCLEIKQENKFYVDKSSVTGYKPNCKTCHNRLKVKNDLKYRKRKYLQDLRYSNVVFEQNYFVLERFMREIKFHHTQGLIRRYLRTQVIGAGLEDPQGIVIYGKWMKINTPEGSFTKDLTKVPIITICNFLQKYEIKIIGEWFKGNPQYNIQLQ